MKNSVLVSLTWSPEENEILLLKIFSYNRAHGCLKNVNRFFGRSMNIILGVIFTLQLQLIHGKFVFLNYCFVKNTFIIKVHAV